MSGLCTLEALLKEHEWDDICAKVNNGKLTLYGWDSYKPDFVRRALEIPLETSPTDHPSGTVLPIGVDVYADDDGNMECRHRYYWGVVANESEVDSVWGDVREARDRGRPASESVEAERALRAIYPDGVPDAITDVELTNVVCDWLKKSGGQLKSISRPTVVKARDAMKINARKCK